MTAEPSKVADVLTTASATLRTDGNDPVATLKAAAVQHDVPYGEIESLFKDRMRLSVEEWSDPRRFGRMWVADLNTMAFQLYGEARMAKLDTLARQYQEEDRTPRSPAD